jgi:hypothetical protein
MNLPLLTIGVLSWNRLHYLRATLESARRCIQYPNLQWIVVDNVSEEPGLADYLKSCDWIDELIFLRSDHVTAMNEIIARARGEAVLLWPDDMQFIVAGDWMTDCLEILRQNEWIGSVGLNCLRRTTLEKTFNAPVWRQIRPVLTEFKWFGTKFRVPSQVSSTRGFTLRTFGWNEDGIVQSGIPSLTRTSVWKALGPWKAPGATSLNDSSGGGELEMLARWRNSGLPLQRAITVLPVAADILTDPLGTKAKVRKNVRYGLYAPPPEGTFYYEILPQPKAEAQLHGSLPLAFEEFVQPLGFNLPLDGQGNLLKTGLNPEIVQEIVSGTTE